MLYIHWTQFALKLNNNSSFYYFPNKNPNVYYLYFVLPHVIFITHTMITDLWFSFMFFPRWFCQSFVLFLNCNVCIISKFFINNCTCDTRIRFSRITNIVVKEVCVLIVWICAFLQQQQNNSSGYPTICRLLSLCTVYLINIF